MKTVNDILQTLIAAVTSSGIASIIIYLIQRRDNKKREEAKNDDVSTKMLLGLAHDRVLSLTERYIRRGCITLKEKTNLKYLYNPYHELGGNGDCETGYDVCQSLNVVSEDIAEDRDIELKRKEFHLIHHDVFIDKEGNDGEENTTRNNC